MFIPSAYHVFTKRKSNPKLQDDGSQKSGLYHIPPADNSLPQSPPPMGEQEKTDLLKRARRLSQVIGDFILPSPVDGIGDTDLVQSSNSTGSSTRGATRLKPPVETSSNLPAPIHSEPDHLYTLNTTANRSPLELENSICSGIQPVEIAPRSPAHPSNSEFLPMRSERRRRGNNRGMSFDSTGLYQLEMTVQRSVLKRPLQRSRSLLIRKADEVRRETGLDEITEDSFDRGSPMSEPFSATQRTLNVKRAKKMAQLFGSEPPQTLFQATNLQDDADDSANAEEYHASLTTLLSPSASNLSSQTPPPDPRKRSGSDASSISPPNSLPGIPVAKSELDLSIQAEACLSTPPPTPPFSDTTSVTPVVSELKPKLSLKSEKEFRRRRLRAAKLAKFFGVGYQDLQPHLPQPPPHFHTGHDTLVEVAIPSAKGTFWERLHNHHRQETNMEDVIHQLREMKAST